MSIFEKVAFVIMVRARSTYAATSEALRIRSLYPNRSSVSRPIQDVKKAGWFICYVDVYPQSDLPAVLDGGGRD